MEFLLQAKRSTYAGQGDEATVTPFVPGSKQLEYRDGDYFYCDIYLGMAYFVGQEVVSFRGHPVWSMCYAGGVTPSSRGRFDPRAIYGFLRSALRHGTEAEPYRGPASSSHESWAYTNSAGAWIPFGGLRRSPVMARGCTNVDTPEASSGEPTVRSNDTRAVH